MRIRILYLVILACASLAFPQDVQWVGSTRLYATGAGALPTRGAVIEPSQTLTVTTETWPISVGQRVFAVTTFDNWATTQDVELTFDAHVANNTRWFGVMGPCAPGSQLQFYVRAQAGTSVRYDNNGWQNFGVYVRFAPAFRNTPILQWFETDYRTILRRLPEVVAAGYGTLYLPPPSKGGGGGFSVGYNPFDRFDLGDRLSVGTVRTKYGTAQEFWELVRVAHRLGIRVIVDAVFNHNDNRAGTPIARYPDLIPEDFHIRSSADTGNDEINFNESGSFTHNLLNRDLVGLVDLAHEDGNLAQTGAFTLPPFAAWNAWGKPSFVRHPRTPAYYPLEAPVAEDARQLLKRWGWFLVDRFGLDGMRLDAVRHTPPAFFDAQLDQPGPAVGQGDLLPFLYGLKPDLTVFGEAYTTSPWELREYAKTGMNLADFPLKGALDNVFNSAGFGDLGGTFSNSLGLEPGTGLAYEQGGLGASIGVAFVQSHDDGPPQADHLAHALMMVRSARPIVYFDGNNVQPGNWGHFPRPGRFDALGAGGDTLLRLVDARVRFGRGALLSRFASSNLLIVERVVNGRGLLLAGLNLRGDFTALTQQVQTAFEEGTVLDDLSGQGPTLTVGQNGVVVVTVPSNSVPGNANNARGYVLYAPRAPGPKKGTSPIDLLDDASGAMLPATDVATPAGTFGPGGSYRAVEATSPLVRVRVRRTGAGSVLVKLDAGMPLGGRTPLANTPEGLADGMVAMDSLSSGLYELGAIDLSQLEPGIHVLRVRTFGAASGPGVFSDAFLFIHWRPTREHAVDGDLSDLGAAVVSQTRTPSSQTNRLDQLFLRNDDRFLYVGLAGRVSTQGNLTNGVVAFLDVDPGAGTGVRRFADLIDDSGPAARLLSNADVTAPPGFGAEFGLAALWGTELHTAPGLGFVGGALAPQPVGAFAGAYRLDPLRLNLLSGRMSAVAYQPRPGPFDPVKGHEFAVPLRDLLASGAGSGVSIGVLAYLCTTGEAGSTLTAHDPLRGVQGGWPLPRAWVSNQFLPPQPSVVGDPGTAPVAATSSAVWTLMRSQEFAGLGLKTLSYAFDAKTGTAQHTVLIRALDPVPGPVFGLIRLAPGVAVSGSRGSSLTAAELEVVMLSSAGLPAGQTTSATLTYRGVTAQHSEPKIRLRAGVGLL